MKIDNIREALDARNSDLTESHFTNVKLARAKFDDANMRSAQFTNVALADSEFVDVDLTGVSIKNANLAGMKINGILVTDLLSAYQNHVTQTGSGTSPA